MPKEFLFKGKNLEELKKLSVREFAKLLQSRKRKSLLKHFDETEKFLLKCRKKQERGKNIRTHKRSLIVVPEMMGMTICIHNGKDFVPVAIKPEMLGHYLGEFAVTRKRVVHSAPGIGATKSSAALSVK